MVKLAKYLKPFAGILVLCVVLLYGQAMCDLNLPNYMSDIVNVGIQQGGVTGAAPEAISEKGFQLVKIFMTQAERERAERAYILVPASGTGAEHSDLVKKYPLLESEDIYVLQKISETPALEKAFGMASWTFINTMKALAEQNGQSLSAGGTDVSAVDLERLYTMLPTLERLPQKALDAARAQAEQNSEAMLLQTGSVFARSFYKELGVDVGGLQNRYILNKGLLMLLVALLGGTATVLVSFFSSRISAGIARDLRRDVFNRVESFSSSEFDRFSTASLITRTTNDVTQVQMLLMLGIRFLCYAPIMGIGGIVMALRKSASMSWVIALAVLVLISLVVTVFSIALPKFKLIQKLVDRLNLVSRENLSGLMVIRAFGTQKFEKERFDKSNRDLTETNLFVNRIMVFMMPAMMLIMNGVSLLIVWVGAHRISESAMQVGDMIAFMQYAMQVIMSFLMLSFMFIMIPRAAVSGDRIQEVLAVRPSIRDPENPCPFVEEKRGWVEFQNVSFRYEGADEDVLQDITFTARPGQTTAFIGSTGSGKSTLINLIPRFYDVTRGAVLVDGVDVRSVTQHDLREQIGYIPQKGVLISGTIASNLRYGGRDASDEELETAARVAQATEFISQKPEGLESHVSQGGSNVSGGQKQRLAIARALVKKPAVYIFDDSFSALDFKTDAALRRALKDYTGESTVLIVAQRVSTIMKADQIIVLDNGKMVGIGTHKELLKSCPTYYEIASSQLSKEELA